MLNTHKGIITSINNSANTKYGKKSVMNVNLGDQEIAIWTQIPGAYKRYRTGQVIECLRDDDDAWTILERDDQAPATLAEIKESAQEYQNTVGDLLEDGDLPIFTDKDLVQIRAFIENQAKLLKYCHEQILSIFPEINIVDPKGARSLAITLLISVNQKYNRIS